ncbi:MAG: ADP-forming succinate--CoA ligase subunit beta [Dehalococcoidia bacterium]|nr:ADP-forming succinate--CoA ligase subunit beta [Dehalococcoidia bacterium]
MKLHEYQAKELLAKYGVPVPKSQMARTPGEAQTAAEAIGGKVVVKAQVHAGGRGKAGGVKLCANPTEARSAAQALLGTRLVTGQSGQNGQPVNEVIVEEAVEIERELYLGVIIDNSAGMPLVICSAAGGMEIEEVAERSPEQIHRQHIDPTIGFQGYQARSLAFATGLDGDLNRPAVALITALAKAFVECDGTLAEINPLVVTKDGRLLAADAKFSIDDNADYRHADLFKLQDKTQDDPLEVRAKDAGIENYVKLDGNIGCLVNGAGLAMATMDAIQFEGGMPANFLDIGTQNDPAAVAEALKIIGADPNVKAVLVNVFGGLARTDVIAEGVVQAKKAGLLPQPTVVRLAGTNVEAGMKILDDSGLDLIRADGFAEAASKAVAAAG